MWLNYVLPISCLLAVPFILPIRCCLQPLSAITQTNHRVEYKRLGLDTGPSVPAIMH